MSLSGKRNPDAETSVDSLIAKEWVTSVARIVELDQKRPTISAKEEAKLEQADFKHTLEVKESKSQQLIDDFIFLKSATHILGLNGFYTLSGREIKAEGSWSKCSIDALQCHLAQFDPKNLNPEEKQRFNQFRQALGRYQATHELVTESSEEAKTSPSSQTLTLTDAELLCHIIDERHAVYSYIYYDKATKSIHVLHCNRGFGLHEKPEKNSSNMLYSLTVDTSEQLALLFFYQLLDSLKKINTESPFVFYDHFHQELMQSGFRYQSGAPVKEQAYDTCTFVNAKSLLADLMEQKHYKEVTQHVRLNIIKQLESKLIFKSAVSTKQEVDHFTQSAELQMLLDYVKNKAKKAFMNFIVTGKVVKLYIIQDILSRLTALAKAASEPIKEYIEREIAPFTPLLTIELHHSPLFINQLLLSAAEEKQFKFIRTILDELHKKPMKLDEKTYNMLSKLFEENTMREEVVLLEDIQAMIQAADKAKKTETSVSAAATALPVQSTSKPSDSKLSIEELKLLEKSSDEGCFEDIQKLLAKLIDKKTCHYYS